MTRDRSKKGLLNYYSDAGFRPPDDWNVDDLSKVEARRVALLAFAGVVAAETPRRLGEDASSWEMAADKFLSRGIAHTYFILWHRLVLSKNAPLKAEELSEFEQWMYPPASWLALHARAMTFEDARRHGRTVIWERWWSELRPRLLARRRAIATFALQNDRMDWGYRIVTSIGSELEWVEMKFQQTYDRYNLSDLDTDEVV